MTGICPFWSDQRKKPPWTWSCSTQRSSSGQSPKFQRGISQGSPCQAKVRLWNIYKHLETNIESITKKYNQVSHWYRGRKDSALFRESMDSLHHDCWQNCRLNHLTTSLLSWRLCFHCLHVAKGHTTTSTSHNQIHKQPTVLGGCSRTFVRCTQNSLLVAKWQGSTLHGGQSLLLWLQKTDYSMTE